jgi:hypothetical protein
VSQMFKDVLEKLVPILLSAAGFLGFVAVAGGVTVYFHFFTAGLPPVKAIDEMPRSQLLVNGAVPLILFGVLGLLAVAVCYAIDRGGRPREGMAHSLVVLFAAATAVVILVAPVEPGDDEWLVDDKVWLLAGIALGAGVAIYLISKQKESVDPSSPRLDPVENEAPEEAPHPFKPTDRLIAGLLAMLAVLALGALVLTGEWWIVVAILVAAVLAVMNFRLAQSTGTRFTAFGIGVFFSLPLFGAVVGLLFLANQPLVQPAALIRNTDEGRLVVEGLYVTDTDSKVVLGSVATEGCGSGSVRRGSGAIFSVPATEVEAIVIGRAQPVADALRNAPALAELLVRNAGSFPDARRRAATRAISARRQRGQPVNGTGTAATGTGTATSGQTEQAKPKWPLRLTRDQAVRQVPEVEPNPRIKGDQVTVEGSGFGDVTGRLLVGGRRASITNWGDDEIVATMPADPRAFRVVVLCPRAGTVTATQHGT